MKKLFLFLALSLAPYAMADDGHNTPAPGQDRGNGGDEYSKQFINLGLDLAEQLSKDPLPGVDANQLLSVVRATFVNSQDELVLDGNRVDAINYPNSNPAKVLVSRSGWDRMSKEPFRRAFLVLHEYLGIMGVDDSRYQISSLLDRAEVCGRTAIVRLAIEKSLRKSCYRIVPDDLLYVGNPNGFNETSFVVNDVNSEVTNLNSFDLKGLTRLTSVRLKTPKLETFPAGLFTSLESVTTLIVSGSPAVAIIGSDNAFKSLPGLQNLYVDYWNGTYSQIAADAFDGMVSLRNLTLGVTLNGYNFTWLSPIKRQVDWLILSFDQIVDLDRLNLNLNEYGLKVHEIRGDKSYVIVQK